MACGQLSVPRSFFGFLKFHASRDGRAGRLNGLPALLAAPRANRFLLPGHVWHITHRCHPREFLLKFGRDRQRWRYWLFEARKRFGLSVLNYV